MSPPFAAALDALAAGDEAAARRGCRLALRADPANPDPARLLGLLLLRAGQPGEAVGWLSWANADPGERAAAWADLADQRAAAGDPTGADAALAIAATLLPGSGIIAVKRATLALQAGDAATAASLLTGIADDDPAADAAAMTLACVHLRQGRPAAALALLDPLAAAAPDSVDVAVNRGNALLALGRFAEAADAYRHALAHDPGAYEALSGLVAAERRFARGLELEADLRAALVAHPTWSAGWLALGNLLIDGGQSAAACAAYRTACALDPRDGAALGNLGAALLQTGDHAAACATLRAAAALAPDDPDIASSLIFAGDFDPAASLADQQALRRAWATRFAPPRPLAPFANVRDPERVLRIGYVSGDFRRHSAAAAFAPLLLGADPATVAITLYSNSPIRDARTDQLRAGHAWRDITALDDAAAAALVRANGIDLLIDLSGHSAGNRLGLFARQPAPIQGTGWGHATGTGLPQIGWLFADPVSIPPSERAAYGERIADLPCILGFVPPADAPAPGWRDDGIIRFGCFNRLGKLSDACLALWAELLAALPGARLVLKDPQLDDAALRAAFLVRAAAAGLAPDRLDLLGGTPQAAHLAALSRLDVALDPFPQGGGVSSLEALWMGVPLVTLPGPTLPQRLGAAILTALGRPDWIAQTPAAYVGIATELARDRATRAALARDLRPTLAGGPLGNPHRYAAAAAAVYRRIWRDWCAESA